MQIPHIVRNADHELYSALQQARPTSLVGPTGSGRTALVERTLRRLETTGVSGVRVACQTVGGATHVAVRLALESDFGPPPGEMPSWDALLAWMQERSHGPVAIVFDDADQPNEEAAAFLDAAQRWLESHPAGQLRIGVVTRCFAGLEGFNERVVRIEPFGVDATSSLSRFFGAHADPDAWARAALAWTGGHAAHTLRLCMELEEAQLPDGVPGDVVDAWVERELLRTGRARRQFLDDQAEGFTALVSRHHGEGALDRYVALLEGEEHIAALDRDGRLLVSAGLAVYDEDNQTLELTSRLQRAVLDQTWIDKVRIAIAGADGGHHSGMATTAPLPAMTEDLRQQLRGHAGAAPDTPTPPPRKRPQTFSGAPIQDIPEREPTAFGMPHPAKEQTWDAGDLGGGGIPSLDWDLDPSDFPDPDSWGLPDDVDGGPFEFMTPGVKPAVDEAPTTEDLEALRPDTLDDPQKLDTVDAPLEAPDRPERGTINAPFGAFGAPEASEEEERSGTVDTALPTFGGPVTHEAPALPTFGVDEGDEDAPTRRPETIMGAPMRDLDDERAAGSSTTLKIKLPPQGNSKTLAGFQVMVGDLANVPRRPTATPLDTDDPMHSKALVNALSTEAATSSELKAVLAPPAEAPVEDVLASLTQDAEGEDALDTLTQDAVAPQDAPPILSPSLPPVSEPYVPTGGSGTLAMPALALGRRDDAAPDPVRHRHTFQDETMPGVPEGATPVAGQPVVTSGANRVLEARAAAQPLVPAEPATMPSPVLQTPTPTPQRDLDATPVPEATRAPMHTPSATATVGSAATAMPAIQAQPALGGQPALGAQAPAGRTPRLTPSEVLQVQAGPPEATLQPGRAPSMTPSAGQPLSLRTEKKRTPWLLYIVLILLGAAMVYLALQVIADHNAAEDDTTSEEATSDP